MKNQGLGPGRLLWTR